jgi:mutator protein MutT
METKDLGRPVPAIRLIVQNDRGCVLVLQRAPGSTDGGRWSLPGGKIDYGETAEQSAERELREETGLIPKNLTFCFFQNSLPPAPGKMHCINLYFRCTFEGELMLNNESVAAAWIAREELERYSLTFRNDEALARFWANPEPVKV